VLRVFGLERTWKEVVLAVFASFLSSQCGKTRMNYGHDSGYRCRGSNWAPLMCLTAGLQWHSAGHSPAPTVGNRLMPSAVKSIEV